MALGLGMYELSFLSGQDALNNREMFLQKIMFLDDISGLFCV